MLLNKLTITNLGVFSGKHEIDLRPKIYKEKVRPIIIFGGMNGAGKTTIFDAIKLCLYGAESLPLQSEAKYKDYLREKINCSNGTLVRPDHASVELEFEYSALGERNLYTIQRYWEKKGKGIAETLIIKKDGNLVDEIDKEYWQEFVKELIPLGLSELFFFDGEKIQKIMSDSDNAELKRSIMSLLGLDLIERLQADLKIYRKNLFKQDSDPTVRADLVALENEIKVRDERIRDLNYRLESVTVSAVRDIEASIADLESRIKAQGGDYFQKRQLLVERKNKAERDLAALAEKLREISAALLPVSLAQKLALRLRQQLEKEALIQIERASESAIKSKIRNLTRELENDEFYGELKGAAVTNKAAFKKSLVKGIRSLLYSDEIESNTSEIHSLSPRQASVIIGNIEEAMRNLPSRLRELSKGYEAKYREIQKLMADLEKVPAEELIQPLYEKLNLLNRDLGAQLAAKKQLDEQKNALLYEKAELVRKKDRLEAKLNASVGNANKIDMIDNTNKVLSAYYNQLTKQKLRKLEAAFAELFLNLHRKDDLISKIEIDQDTMDVYIYDKYGGRLNKNKLSSGELEIYAISMVWALARTSGQSLPFAIDTPLARLDSKHRDNLIDMFFPHASHQMLIFSTDTEVDEKYFHKLEPYISKAYKFEYLDYEKRSEIQEGYFWN